MTIHKVARELEQKYFSKFAKNNEAYQAQFEKALWDAYAKVLSIYGKKTSSLQKRLERLGIDFDVVVIPKEIVPRGNDVTIKVPQNFYNDEVYAMIRKEVQKFDPQANLFVEESTAPPPQTPNV